MQLDKLSKQTNMKQIISFTLFSLLFARTSAAILNTTLAGGNTQAGNLFDLCAKTNLQITSLDINCGSTGSFTVEIYIATAMNVSYTQIRFDVPSWTLIHQQNGTCQPVGTLTVLNAFNINTIPALINNGDCRCFYVTRTTGSLQYTNGVSIGSIFASNADLDFKEGAGNEYPFGITTSPRVWNGRIHYNVITDAPTTATPTTDPTQIPTQNPSTSNPTQNPSTSNPTLNPSTSNPTQNPSTSNPTLNPSTSNPTQNPSTTNPTQNPSTEQTNIASGNVQSTNTTAFQSPNEYGKGKANSNKEIIWIFISILSVIACINIVCAAFYFINKRKRLVAKNIANYISGGETMEDANIENIKGGNECGIELEAVHSGNGPEISDDSGEDLYSQNYKSAIKDEAETAGNELYDTALTIQMHLTVNETEDGNTVTDEGATTKL